MILVIALITAYLFIVFLLARFMIGATYKPSLSTKLALIGMALVWPLLPIAVLIYTRLRKKNEF